MKAAKYTSRYVKDGANDAICVEVRAGEKGKGTVLYLHTY